jgi:hypothetical protein
MRVSAEAACEIMHKTVPRNRRQRDDQGTTIRSASGPRRGRAFDADARLRPGCATPFTSAPAARQAMLTQQQESMKVTL